MYEKELSLYMENKKMKFPIAGILFIINILLTASGIINPLANHSFLPAFLIIISIIIQIAFVVFLFKRKHGFVLFGGTVAMMIPAVVSFVFEIGIFSSVFDLIAHLFLIIIVAIATLPQLQKFKAIAKKVYLLLAVFPIISMIIEIATYPSNDWVPESISVVLEEILLAAVLLFLFCAPNLLLAQWALDPYEKEKPVNDTLANNTATGNAVLDYNEAYCELVKHILLSLFTCGIWMMIWIHKTTKVLNKTPGAEQYDPTKKLLLCLFVPFYMVYWFKKHGERIDKLNAIQNNKSDNATMYLLLGLFIPVVACILMQDNINKLCAPATTTPQYVSAAPVSTEKSNVELMKEYKELLDMGVITQEEFDAKKQQLLNL